MRLVIERPGFVAKDGMLVPHESLPYGESALMWPPMFAELKRVVKQYGIVNLVETGTGPYSSGLEAAHRLGLKGYSCDVYRPCVDRAAQIYPEAKVFYCDSLEMLRHILPTLEGPTFFWLDGHCPTDGSNLTILDKPIFPTFEELALITTLKPDFANDVMWCDNIAMLNIPDNPHGVGQFIKDGVDLAGRQWDGEKSHTWAEYKALMAPTHVWTHPEQDQFRFWPKDNPLDLVIADYIGVEDAHHDV